MKTLIFDIDGTLTDMSSIERAVYQTINKRYAGAGRRRADYRDAFVRLANANALPIPNAYKTVQFIRQYASNYIFVYATGAQDVEVAYVLQSLGIRQFFDEQYSTTITNCRFSKKTGIPLRRIAKRYPDCLLITDSSSDVAGAQKAHVPAVLLQPNAKLTTRGIEKAARLYR